MEQKDYILREIEKIGTLLIYLIEKFKKSNTQLENDENIVLVNTELVEKSGINIENLLTIKEENFDKIISLNKGFNFENIELLADLLFTIGNEENTIKKTYLNKALELYNYINTKTKTFSFDREEKMNTIKNLL